MVDKKKEKYKGFKLDMRTIYKLKKLKESGHFRNETTIIETGIDILYEAFIKNKLKEFIEEYEVE